MAMMMVHMRCGKCRTNALTVAAKTYGVTATRLDREDFEKLIVEGHRVEIDELVPTLKKKVGYTQILFVNNL